MSSDLRYLILADGLFGPEESKTANACIRYTPERVVAILDASKAGSTAQAVLGLWSGVRGSNVIIDTPATLTAIID